VDWIQVAHDKAQWQALVNKQRSIQFHKTRGIFWLAERLSASWKNYPITYNCSRDYHRREENSFENIERLLQVFYDHIVVWFNNIVSERHKEICLLGDLKQKEVKRIFNQTGGIGRQIILLTCCQLSF
jgi:hypothetical protein